MKAIRKKYGKSKWMDTPLSRYYKKAINSVRFMSRVRCVSISSGGLAHYQNVLRHPAGMNINKSMELSNIKLSTARAIDEVVSKANEDIKLINKRYGVK